MLMISYYVREKDTTVLYIRSCHSVADFWRYAHESDIKPYHVQVLGTATAVQKKLFEKKYEKARLEA